MSSPGGGWDRWAPVYRGLERLALGGALQRTRVEAARIAAGAPGPPGARWLLLGDGDGRGLLQCLRQLPHATFVTVDRSPAMLARSRARVEREPDRARVTWHRADLQHEAPLPSGASPVDGVITSFFLDCFTAEELAAWWPRVARIVRPGGVWVVAEFTPPGGEFRTPWRRIRQRLLLPALYAAFRATTPMTARALPDVEAPFREAGWHRRHHARLPGDLTCVTSWLAPPSSEPGLP